MEGDIPVMSNINKNLVQSVQFAEVFGFDKVQPPRRGDLRGRQGSNKGMINAKFKKALKYFIRTLGDMVRGLNRNA